MKNIKLNKVVLLCMLFLSSFTAMADDIDDGNGTGDVIDTPAAPIDDYIPLAIVATIAFSYVLLRKKQLNF